jgi:hypothetical protein
MTIGFDRVNEAFTKHGMSSEVQEFRDTYDGLTTRIESECAVPPKGEWGDARRVRAYAVALRQVLLHRAIALFEGALWASVDENAYLMVLAIRALFETTAALGYLHNRLSSLNRGDLEAAKVDEDIMIQLLGIKDNHIPGAMTPKQILSMLEYADVSVSRRILGGAPRQYTMLGESYDFLCEFAHPNFHSNKVAFDLDKVGQRFVLRHRKDMQDEEFRVVSYLLISAPLHVELHDAIDEVLPIETF